MTKEEIDAKPLSRWLAEAIRRVKAGAFSKNDEVIEYTFDIWRDLALKQEKEIRKLKKLLEIAKCPQCDGSGAYPSGHPLDPDWEQCQWCNERKQTLK